MHILSQRVATRIVRADTPEYRSIMEHRQFVYHFGYLVTSFVFPRYSFVVKTLTAGRKMYKYIGRTFCLFNIHYTTFNSTLNVFKSW